MLLFLQVALRRQQAQELELGLYHPVTLAGTEMLVKTENRMEVTAQSPVGGASSVHAVTGEIMAFFFLSVPPHLRATLQSVEIQKAPPTTQLDYSKLYMKQLNMKKCISVF